MWQTNCPTVENAAGLNISNSYIHILKCQMSLYAGPMEPTAVLLQTEKKEVRKLMRLEHLKSKQLVSYSSNGNCIDVKCCNDIYFSLLQGMMEGARQKVCNA